MTPADIAHLRQICATADSNATVTLMPVRVLRDLLAAWEAQNKAQPDGMAGRGA